jgi:hypothetical protein
VTSWRTSRARVAALVVLAAVALSCRRAARPADKREVSAPVPPPAASRPVAEVSDTPEETEALVGEEREPDPRSETVTIALVADPRRRARVFWGRKDLGFAPLEITRPRGSGPLDLLVTAPGCLPLHTRAFTDRDDKLTLRLYAERDARTLLGYHDQKRHEQESERERDAEPSAAAR